MHFKLLDRLSGVVAACSGAALVVLVAITGWQVWGRYVLNDTPTWAERLSLLLILAVALPLAAIGLRENTHLGVSMLSEMLPPRGRRALEIFNTILLGLFGIAMAWHSWTLTAMTWGRKIPLLGWPQGMQYLPLVICGALVAIFMAERLWFLLKPAESA